jgi:hypothetical protein
MKARLALQVPSQLWCSSITATHCGDGCPNTAKSRMAIICPYHQIHHRVAMLVLHGTAIRHF